MSLAPWPSRTRGAGAIASSSSSSSSHRAPSSSPTSGNSSRRKRSREAAQQGSDDGNNNDDDEPLAPELTDVAAALSLLGQRFQTSHQNQTRTPSSNASPSAGCPVVLHHQLYTILDDHTAVDVELEDLRRRNYVRLLRLLTLRRDVAVLLTSTYVARVQAALDAYAQQVELEEQQRDQPEDEKKKGAKLKKDEEEAAGKGMSHDGGGDTQKKKKKKGATTATSKTSAQDMVSVFSFFLKAIDTFTSLSVTRRQLDALLTEHIGTLAPPPPKHPRTHFSSSSSSTSCSSSSSRSINQPHPTTDLTIRVLLHSGFLARRVDAAHEEEAYWFSAPELGRVTASLPHGRKAILAALRRSRYKELSERNLGAIDLGKTVLSLPFHIADLVGSKEVLGVPTASGLFLKLPPAAAAAAAATGGRGRRT